MAPTGNGHFGGTSVHGINDTPFAEIRFKDIPSAIDIVVQAMDSEEAVEIDLEGLPDDPTELCTLLENEAVGRNYWMTIALAYAKDHKMDQAIEVLTKALTVSQEQPKGKLPMLSCLCSLNLYKAREASRLVPDGTLVSEARTKDYYLKAATTILNEASRINPGFPPLFLARGVLYLLRASLLPPSTGKITGSQEQSERVTTLMQAMKSFEDASRVSQGKNVLAVMGKARAQYALGKYGDALAGYQDVLQRLPMLQDPDPRIGIGCCLWQLGFKDDAKVAWERAVEVNPESSVANVLVGLYHLESSSHLALNNPAFLAKYKKAMTECTQRAFKLNKDLPLACVTFANYFYSRRAMPTVETLARKAIEFTDVNAIASDGWYLLARKEHSANEFHKAGEFYRKADDARGGMDKGFFPAKLGAAQIQAQLGDMDGAKFRLEKAMQHGKCIEGQTLLGTIYAEEVFTSQTTNAKDDKANERRKAIKNLEAVRQAWSHPSGRHHPDCEVGLNLARLYEKESTEKSRQCLVEVEQMELERIANQRRAQHPDGEVEAPSELREYLPPQLLSNMGCFSYAAEQYEEARADFQMALNACVKLSQKEDAIDTDALVTTISYNLARAYEADGMLDEAKKVYEGLLERHGDYTDASTRLAYIALRQSPTDEGPKTVSKLVQGNPGDLEVRALYGWYLSKSKKRSANLAEDPEQRHYKHTLQHFDKHDRYSLTGMGNLYLTNAREMRRESEADREKRRKTYEKAVEFFDKALQLDPQNAYAAQGIAIALVEDRKDYSTAIQIFGKLRDAVRDTNVAVNLGHAYAEVKQYSRSIEMYEMAVAKDKGRDPQILACLGRVWLLRGKQDKSIDAIKRSLEYSQQALQIGGDQVHFRFNVAFVQIQMAQLIHVLPEHQRTLVDVQAAAQGLDEAIESLSEIAQSENPPYPRNELEQRANMGRNTMRRQLERAVQSQREYEEKNASKLQRAREQREEEMRRREEEQRKAEAQAMERKRRLAEERQKMVERDRELAEKRALEQRRKEDEEMETDSETGERRKKKRRATGGRRKKQADDDEMHSDGDEAGQERKKKRIRRKKSEDVSGVATSENDSGAPKKRRRVQRKGATRTSNKYKSSELVVDSDEDVEEAPVQSDELFGGGEDDNEVSQEPVKPIANGAVNDAEEDDDDEEMERRPVRSTRKKKMARTIGESDDDDEDADVVGNDDAVAAAKTRAVHTDDDEDEPGDAGERVNGSVPDAEPSEDGGGDVEMEDATPADVVEEGDEEDEA